MRRVINIVLIAGAVCVTVATLFALTNILQDLWMQSIVPASAVDVEDSSNTFKEAALGFAFMALPFLGCMWGITMAVVRREQRA